MRSTISALHAILVAAILGLGSLLPAQSQDVMSPLYAELTNRQRTVLKETVKDWTLQCYTLIGSLKSDMPHGCMIYTLREIGGNFVALQVDGIFPTGDSIILRFATSFQVSPDTPVSVDFGFGIANFRFERNDAGVSEVEFAEGRDMTISAMKGGNSIRFQLTQKNGNVIDERFSLAGFSAIWKAYQEKLQNPNDFPPIEGYADLFGPARTAEEVRAVDKCTGALTKEGFISFCEAVLGFENFTPAERGAVLATSYYADRPSAGTLPEDYSDEVKALLTRALEIDPFNYPLSYLLYALEPNTESFVRLTAAQMFSTPEQGMAQIKMAELSTGWVFKNLYYVTGSVTFEDMCTEAQKVAATYAGGWAEAEKAHPIVAFTVLEDHDEQTCAALLAKDTAPTAAAPTAPADGAETTPPDVLSAADAATLTKALSNILATNPSAKADMALAELALALSAAYQGDDATAQAATWKDLRAAIDGRDWLLAEVQKLGLAAYPAQSAESLQAVISLQRAVLLTYAASHLDDERSPEWQKLISSAKAEGASSDIAVLQKLSSALDLELSSLGLESVFSEQALQACNAGTTALCR